MPTAGGIIARMTADRLDVLEAEVRRLAGSLKRLRVFALIGWVLAAGGIGYVGWRALRPAQPASELTLVDGDRTVRLSPWELEFHHGTKLSAQIDPGIGTIVLNSDDKGGAFFGTKHLFFFDEGNNVSLDKNGLLIESKEGSLTFHRSKDGTLTRFDPN